jgi:hypothetical protein
MENIYMICNAYVLNITYLSGGILNSKEDYHKGTNFS